MAAFVDTNILIYAYVINAANDPQKVLKAKNLLARLMFHQELILSAQVLSEFTSASTRKGQPPLTIAEVLVIAAELSRFQVIPIDASLVQLAIRRVQTSQLSYWDSLIVEAALRARATTLYTEDMHHGTRFGTLDLINPFV